MRENVDSDLVRPFPLFSRLSDEELSRILARTNSRRYAVSDVVFEQGQSADYFFVLLHGRLRVTQVNREGQQTIVRMVNPGDLFGIAKALKRSDYPGTSTAVVESIVLAWPMAFWDELLEDHPAFAVNAMQTMGQRLQEAQTRLRELATEDVERRVAHAVLRLAGQSGRKQDGGIQIDFPVSKQDIAEMSGTTLYSVSRILSAWEAAGLVEGGRQKLLVKDAHRLLLIGDGHLAGCLGPAAR